MLHVCWQCGAFHAEKLILPGPHAVCPACGYQHHFRQLPLFLVGGASGTGKSTVCQALLGMHDQIVVLDSDTLWQPAFNTPDDGYRAFFTTWLRLCIDISQAGRPVLLFGAGIGVPANLAALPQQRYFRGLHYLALTCDDELLRKRLQARPAWRASGSAEFIEGQVAFNRWYREHGPHQTPAIQLLDTTTASPSETALAVMAMVERRMMDAGR